MTLPKRKDFQQRITDAVGKKYGRLLVLRFACVKNENIHVDCQCDCGKTHNARLSRLIAGRLKSCGCLAVDAIRARAKQHGMYETRIYRIWRNMLSRCRNPKYDQFHNYGGRGITVCKEWERFKNFYADIGEPPPGMELDRKDNDAGYSKSNCRWATKSDNNNNTRRNHWVEAFGERLTLAQWSKRNNVHSSVIARRLESGWTPERAVIHP